MDGEDESGPRVSPPMLLLLVSPLASRDAKQKVTGRVELGATFHVDELL